MSILPLKEFWNTGMIGLTNGLQESGHGLLNISKQVDINTVDKFTMSSHILKHPCIVFDLHGIGVF